MPADRDGAAEDASAGRSRPADRRGPLRPRQLVPLRDRQSSRQAAHGFRLVDVVVLAAVSVAAVRTTGSGSVLARTVAEVLPIVAAASTTGRTLRSLGLYRFGRRERYVAHVGRLLAAGAAGVLVGALLAALLDGDPGPGAVVAWALPAVGALLGLHTLWWVIVRRWRSRGRLTPNIVLVGATRHAEQIVRDALAAGDVNVLGIFDDRLARSPAAVAGVPVLGDVAALVGHRITPAVDLIVVAVDPAARERIRHVVDRLAQLPNDVVLVVDDGGDQRQAAIRRLADAPLAPLDVVIDPGRRAVAKRLQDVVVAGTLLVAMSPLLGLLALAVRLDSPGPVFFRQRRHGFNNEEIVVWKFRTMRAEATDHHAVRQVTADDDRVTRVGRLLRSTSLDELPQLLNVVGGSMSLVGPRPHAIGMQTGDEASAGLVAHYARRHRIKPGMTGWAAINGSRGPVPTADDVRRRVAFDVEYIDRQSFWLDLWILARTVPSLVGDRATVR